MDTQMFYVLELQHKSMAYLIVLSCFIYPFFIFVPPFTSFPLCSWVKRAVWSIEYFSRGPFQSLSKRSSLALVFFGLINL